MDEFEITDDELSQADLSHLRVAEMTDAQKAELRRRYFEFVRVAAKAPPKAATPARRPPGTAKWIPGAKPRS
ncbi:MAG: hypothetical protein JWL84_2102 [Rhodospirillales bacterium]|jgi:hypothetical protein|nr:hypothetical protein [Rhodospirillales bacterium]